MTKLRLFTCLGLLGAATLPSACRDGDSSATAGPSSPARGTSAGGSGAQGQGGAAGAGAVAGATTAEGGRGTDDGGGASGSGGTQGDGYAWVHDAQAWREPTVVGPCRPASAILDKLEFPGTEWTECGDGCRSLKPVRGEAAVIGDDYRSGLRVGAHGTELYLSMGIKTDPGFSLLGLFEYDTDLHPLALIKQSASGCIDRFLSRESPHTVTTVVNGAAGSGLQLYIGRIDSTSDAPNWLEPAIVNPAFSGFDYQDGWGAIWDGRTLAAASPGSATQNELYTSNGNLLHPHSNGGRVVFAESRSGSNAIFGWKAGAREPELLAEADSDVVDLAVSSSKVVWVGATGPRTREGSYEAASLRWRALDAASDDDGQQLKLPITRSADKLTTQGKWALLGGCEGDECGVYLVDLMNRTVHRRRPTAVPIWRAFGVVDDRLLITEEDADAPAGFFSRIVEYRIPEFIATAELVQG